LKRKSPRPGEQLNKYAQDDHVVRAMSKGKLKKIVLVYHGVGDGVQGVTALSVKFHIDNSLCLPTEIHKFAKKI